MPTLKELKNISARSGFTEAMQKEGFLLGNSSFWFYRWRGEYLDVICFWLKSSKEWVDIPVFTITKELIEYDFNKFPKGIYQKLTNNLGTNITEEGIEIYGYPWEIENSDQVEDMFSKLLDIVPNKAIPWLNCIVSNQKLFELISRGGSRTDDYVEELKGKLLN